MSEREDRLTHSFILLVYNILNISSKALKSVGALYRLIDLFLVGYVS